MEEKKIEILGVRGIVLSWLKRSPWMWRTIQCWNPEIRFSAVRVNCEEVGTLLVPWEQVEQELGVFFGGRDYLVSLERCFPETAEDVFHLDFIFDIGANIGGFTLAARSRFQDAEIVALEPNPICFRLLDANTKERRIECVEKAIGASKGKVEMAKGMSLTTASLGDSGVYKVKAGKRRYFARNEQVWDETFEVECIGIGDLFENADGDVLLKVDCEGGEYHIFKEENREVLSNVDYLLMEAHPSDIGMPDDLMEILERWGFQSVREPMSNGCEMIYAKGPATTDS